MGFTTETIAPPPTGRALAEPAQFDLPVKEFVGYDPKGQAPTNSPLVQKTKAEPQQTAEVAPEVEEEKEESITLSPKLSALARKEQAQRARERAIVEKERTFAEKMADAEKYQQLKAKVASEDFSGVEELGVSYDKYVKHELNKEAKSPEEIRIQQLEEKLTAVQKAQDEKEVQEYQANQALWQKEIGKVVSENPEFSAIKRKGAEAAVLQHINDSFNDDGKELTVEEAAKDIESALRAKAQEWKDILELDQPEPKVPDARVLGAPKTQIKTITQNMTTSSVKQVAKPFHLMSESEQLQEAIRRVQAAKLQR